MYGDTKTSKDRLDKKTKTGGIFGKRSKHEALEKKKNCKCKDGKCICK